ncbi:MAG: methyltransferase type 11 [Acidobacteria bacterium RIFCSPLOWO2_12_FULL_67_14]|nr:MAG: methyltransferase type 11 [Acidobacteria bacterium RIFCSPLOWO2_02_FULL_67_21]OFW40675.1 MAG: methyltransferase type 11 [Acidobacteria bacterium RIFCSPLOWO2_12_FULL_67_14]
MKAGIQRLAVVLVAVAVASTATAARQREGVHPVSGRVYAGTMGVSGAPWLDRMQRDREEAPGQALRIIGITPGSAVADVGAGSGYFTLRMARMVGPSGRVYANDIQQGMLDIIREKVETMRLDNVTLVLGTQDDPRLPPASLDLALMVDVYHELQAPQAMLQKLHGALKPQGRLVLLEYREEDPSVPILPLHKMSVAVAKLEVEHEGFRLARVNEDLPWQHVLIFERK